MNNYRIIYKMPQGSDPEKLRHLDFNSSAKEEQKLKTAALKTLKKNWNVPSQGNDQLFEILGVYNTDELGN